MKFDITSPKEIEFRETLAKNIDADSKRLVRFLSMPDLSRVHGSPIHELAERILSLPSFASFDEIHVPEIVPADISFDLFDFPKDHPARSKSDTYYLDDNNILRTHTTVMWHYYLAQDEIKKKIAQGLPVGSLSYGKVYRKDEIDRHHMNVFHQMDGWYLCKKSEKVITTEDLQNVLVDIAKAVFGDKVKYRFNPDKFPYTDPSLEMEIEKPSFAKASADAKALSDKSEGEDNKWIEVLGSGVVKGSVLKKLGVDPEAYNGWAFGFGLERLAIISMELPDIRLLWSEDPRVKSQLKLGNKFKEVSKFPGITRDISFIVSDTFIPNNYFDIIRDIGGDLVEEVKLLDKYENAEKFGKEKISYTYRISYRSNERTLRTEEIEPIQNKIIEETNKQFNAEVR
ncbi:MAG: hypothetical protein Q8L47_04555 [bacterium]|nr:hypothetical protein [bacterium]